MNPVPPNRRCSCSKADFFIKMEVLRDIISFNYGPFMCIIKQRGMRSLSIFNPKGLKLLAGTFLS